MSAVTPYSHELSMNEGKNYHIPAATTLCTQGTRRRDSGVRQGDSGSSLNLKINGRLSFYFNATCQLLSFKVHSDWSD